jgi:hypothetical protein
VADVAFIGHTLYGLLAGAGCSHGVPDFPNGVFRVNKNKTWTLINDLSAFYKSHPVKNPNPGDFEPDGTTYSMISLGDRLFSVEPNHGELDEMSLDGSIHRIIDISAFFGHIVPTAMTFHDGNFYVGNLDVFPATGNSAIYKITPQGQISTYATGFNMVLGVQFDLLGGFIRIGKYNRESLSYAGYRGCYTGRSGRIPHDHCLQTEPGDSHDLRA